MPDKLKAPIRGHFVAYVGRAADLDKRLRSHFYLTKKPTTNEQVQRVLRDSLRYGKLETIEFMLQHGSIAYCFLPGTTNVANRDIVEVALWAIYRSPFNIKSEH
jgi:hypothetical protein